MTKISVVGSVNLDLSAAVDRLPLPGETVTNATLSRHPGGKGGNQALAARRLGADVQLIACVGDDAAADEALSLLNEDGVDLSLVTRVADAATGTALIAVASSGENHIVVAPGANRHLSSEHLPEFDSDALICQLEVPADTMTAAISSFDGFVCANLAPAREVDVAVLQRADLIIVNEVEANWYGATLGACSGYVATTYGAAGAVIEKGGEVVARARAPRVRAIDTVGAGDAFTAALTLALVEQQAPDAALRFACACGALTTTSSGAQPSLPGRTAVEALLESEA